MTAEDVGIAARLMDKLFAEARTGGRGVMLSWEDANGFALTLHAASADLAALASEVARTAEERDHAWAELAAIKLLCPVSPDTVLPGPGALERVRHTFAQKEKLRSIIEASEATRMQERDAAESEVARLTEDAARLRGLERFACTIETRDSEGYEERFERGSDEDTPFLDWLGFVIETAEANEADANG